MQLEEGTWTLVEALASLGSPHSFSLPFQGLCSQTEGLAETRGSVVFIRKQDYSSKC